MKTMQKTLVAALGIAAAFAVAAADLPDRIKKAGKIVIATQPNYPPIAYKDPATNQLTGLRHRPRRSDRQGARRQGRMAGNRVRADDQLAADRRASTSRWPG